MNSILAFSFGAPGLPELIIFGTIALLLFGKRLPDVARSLGKGIVEFKKGVKGIEEDVDQSTYDTTASAPRPSTPAEDEPSEITAPKFEPPKFDTDGDDKPADA